MPLLQAESRSSLSVLKSSRRQLTNNMPLNEAAHDSGSSSAEFHSDSSQSVGKSRRSASKYDSVIKMITFIFYHFTALQSDLLRDPDHEVRNTRIEIFFISD